MRVGDLEFDHVTAIDFEFYQPDGEVPAPLCAVAIDAATGAASRWWQDQLYTFPAPPYPCGPRDLVVAFYASAELGCHLQLGWALPDNICTAGSRHRPCGQHTTACRIAHISLLET